MSTRRNKWVLVGIFMLFFTPLILAVLMRSDWWDFTPSGAINAGQLVQPPLPIALDELEFQHGELSALQDKWLLFYWLEPGCDEPCERQVTSLRQVHKATGRNRDRVAVVLIENPAINPETLKRLVAIYPSLLILGDSKGTATLTLDRLEAIPGQAFIIDPSGNIVLSYAAGFAPGDINGDLKRLLKWSPQGES